MASELSSGREIDGLSGEVVFRRACPSANLGLSIAVNTGEARLSTLEILESMTGSAFHLHLFRVLITDRQPDQHHQVGVNPTSFLRYGPWW